jgi:hypothetical protein
MYTTGVVCHVLNRAGGRAEIFQSAADYATFEELLAAAFPSAAMIGDERRQTASGFHSGGPGRPAEETPGGKSALSRSTENLLPP